MGKQTEFRQLTCFFRIEYVLRHYIFREKQYGQKLSGRLRRNSPCLTRLRYFRLRQIDPEKALIGRWRSPENNLRLVINSVKITGEG